MISNRMLWTKRSVRDTHPYYQEVYNFIDAVSSSVMDFDLSEIESDFIKLPEINNSSQEFTELSPEGKLFFDQIDLICNQNPVVGLKILTILVAGMGVLSYSPELKEIVFVKFKDLIFLESLNRRTRIEWGVFCWKNWPIRILNFERDKFSGLVLKLLIEESKYNPKYVFDLYSKVNERRFRENYFFELHDNCEDFLILARNICKIKPNILHEALMSCMRHHHSKLLVEVEAPAIDKFHGVCKDLFDLYNKGENLTTQESEVILDELIVYADPTLGWYDQLHERLWNIEKFKIQRDRSSIKNHFIIFLNAQSDKVYLSEIMASYKQWLYQYKNPERLRVEDVVAHLGHIIGFIDKSLRERSCVRNKFILKPKNQQITEETICAFWAILQYLREYSTELYLYGLEAALEEQQSTVSIVCDIGLESKNLFVAAFKEFSVESPEKSATLVAHLINRSKFSGIDIYIKEVLDIVYPMLESLNIALAEQAFREGTKGEFGHMQCWRPWRFE